MSEAELMFGWDDLSYFWSGLYWVPLIVYLCQQLIFFGHLPWRWGRVCVSQNYCYWIFHRRVSCIINQYFIRYIVLKKKFFNHAVSINQCNPHQCNTYHINNNFDLSNTLIKSNTFGYVKEVYRIIHNAKNV